MSANPIDLVGGLTTADNVSKADFVAWAKARVAQVFADAAEIRNTLLISQQAVWLKATGVLYRLDTSDTTTPDDGINCIISSDGYRFKATSSGIPGGTERTVIVSGAVTIAAVDADVILIKKTVGEATRVIYPASSSVTTKKRVADRKYDAATNNITVVPVRPDTVTVTIASPGVFTKVAHGRAVDSPVSLETSGALPTGLSADTQYYVKTVPTADTFTLAATPGGAAINTTGSQSGTHKMGTDTIMGGASYVIDSNGGSIELKPLSDGTGWI